MSQQKIENLSAVNTQCIEGRYLIAALSIITDTVGEVPANIESALEKMEKIQEKVYEDNPLVVTMEPKKTFESELESLINRHSKENESNTPDYILRDYLVDCLAAFTKCSRARERWYGKELKII